MCWQDRRVAQYLHLTPLLEATVYGFVVGERFGRSGHRAPVFENSQHGVEYRGRRNRLASRSFIRNTFIRNFSLMHIPCSSVTRIARSILGLLMHSARF